MRCDAMRCDAMRCDAMRCDAMRCDAMRCYTRSSAPRCRSRRRPAQRPSTCTSAPTTAAPHNFISLHHPTPHPSRYFSRRSSASFSSGGRTRLHTHLMDVAQHYVLGGAAPGGAPVQQWCVLTGQRRSRVPRCAPRRAQWRARRHLKRHARDAATRHSAAAGSMASRTQQAEQPVQRLSY
jgi:hypothetical protein